MELGNLPRLVSHLLHHMIRHMNPPQCTCATPRIPPRYPARRKTPHGEDEVQVCWWDAGE
jgi:hypothetical protein